MDFFSYFRFHSIVDILLVPFSSTSSISGYEKAVRCEP